MEGCLFYLCGLVVSAVAIALEALAAIHGAVALGLERHLSGGSAAVADDFVVLAIRTAGVVAVAASHTAVVAAGRIVLEALLGEELLLRSGEHEFLATVAADKRFVFKHDRFPSIILVMFCVPFAVFAWSWVSMLPNIPERRRRNLHRNTLAGQQMHYSMRNEKSKRFLKISFKMKKLILISLIKNMVIILALI